MSEMEARTIAKYIAAEGGCNKAKLVNLITSELMRAYMLGDTTGWMEARKELDARIDFGTDE
jgi:hypothetical protein